MSEQPNPVTPLVALGATAFLASAVAALWLSDARWLPAGLATLLASAIWSAARQKGR